MKRFGVILGGLAICAAFVLLSGGLPSCSALTESQQAKLLTVAQVGLTVAANQGVISPGDSLLIGTTTAVLLKPGTKEEKLVGLATIGLDQAVQEGVLKPGDAVLIKDAVNVLVTPAPDPLMPVTNAGAQGATGPPETPAK